MILYNSVTLMFLAVGSRSQSHKTVVILSLLLAKNLMH